jgi:hypothetical protein
MNNDETQFNRRFLVPVLGSFAIFTFIVVLRLGLGATPYSTTDSLGRPMGFNDPLFTEHYFIMASNFNAADLFKFERWYEWLLAAAHIVGAGLLWKGAHISVRAARWFFASQMFLFPFGVIAIVFLPLLVVGSVFNRADRESFVDVPFIIMIAHPVWLLTSLYITFALHGAGLGLSKVWAGMKRMFLPGARTVVNAVR